MMYRQIVLEIWLLTGSTTYLVQKRFIPADHSFFSSFFSFVCSPPFCFVRFEELCTDSFEVVLAMMTLFDMVRVSEINLNEKINLPISPLKFLYYMIFFSVDDFHDEKVFFRVPRVWSTFKKTWLRLQRKCIQFLTGMLNKMWWWCLYDVLKTNEQHPQRTKEHDEMETFWSLPEDTMTPLVRII